jgi:hypothetical protein
MRRGPARRMNRSTSSFDAKESFFKLPRKLKGDALADRVAADLARWNEYARLMAQNNEVETFELAPLSHRFGEGRRELFPQSWPETPRSSWNTSE